MSHTLANQIRQRLDELAEAYRERLVAIGGGYEASAAEEVDRMARHDLELLAQALEAETPSLFWEWVHSLVRKQLEVGFDSGTLLHAITALEDTLSPYTEDPDALRLLWKMTREARNIVARLTIQKLRQSELGFQRIFDRSPVGLFRTTLEGKILQANSTFLKIVGYDSLEDLQQAGSPSLYANPQDRQRLVAMLQQGPVTEFETHFQRFDGQTVPVAITVRTVEEGAFLEGIIEDISARVAAEQAVQASQQRLQLIVDNLPQSIFWKDTDSKYLGCNRHFARDMGLRSPEAIIGHSDFDMPWNEQAERYRAQDLRVIETGEAILNLEEPQTTRSGKEIWWRTSLIPMREKDGQITAVLGMYEDITARKRLEIEREQAYERRARQVQISTQVVQEIASAPALDDLFQNVVTLIKERFGYYHVQIFRYEPALDAVLLVSGYGDAGQRMLAEGHQVELGQGPELVEGRGAVGVAASQQQPVLETDLTETVGWAPDPRLPDTKCELAVPIKLHKELLGVLDVHGDAIDALTQDDQFLLESLCGQIAIAIESTRLRQEMEENLREMNALYRVTTREGWQTAKTSVPSYAFDPSAETVSPCPSAGSGPCPSAGSGPGKSDEMDENMLEVPLQLRGEPIGMISVRDDPQTPLSEEELALLTSVAEQATQALESARLFEQTQATLAETRALYRFSDVVSREMNLPVVYKAASQLLVEELGYAGAWVSVLEKDGIRSVAGAGKVLTDLHSPAVVAALRLAQDLVQKRAPVLINDPSQEAWIQSNPELRATLGQFRIAQVPILAAGGDEVFGIVTVSRSVTEAEIGERDLRLLQAVAAQTFIAVQRVQLFDQTQSALSETEGLYLASAELNTAQRYDDILVVLRQHTLLEGAHHLSISLFDRPWMPGLAQPEWIDTIARRTTLTSKAYRPRYPLREFPAASLFMLGHETKVIEDVKRDQSLSELERRLLLDNFEAASTAFVPLVAGGQQIGFVHAAYRTLTHFPQERVRRLTTLSGQAAVAVQSLRQLSQIQDRAQREQALRQVVGTINASEDLVADLPAIREQLGEIVPVDLLILATVVPGDPEFTFFANADPQVQTPYLEQQGRRLPLKGSGPGWVIEHQASCVSADLRLEKNLVDDEQLGAAGIAARLWLPLQVGEGVIGALGLGSRQADVFTQERQDALIQVAYQVALALERARLLESTQDALAEVEATQRRYLREQWADMLSAQPDRVLGYLDGPDGLTMAEDFWAPEIEQAVNTGLPSTAVRGSDKAHPIQQVALAVPIQLRGQTIGVLDFYDEGRVWTEQDKQLVQALSEQVAQALENARLFEQTQRRAYRERLAGEIVGKIRTAGDVSSILETAAQELGRALGVSRALVRLGPPENGARHHLPSLANVRQDFGRAVPGEPVEGARPEPVEGARPEPVEGDARDQDTTVESGAER